MLQARWSFKFFSWTPGRHTRCVFQAGDGRNFASKKNTLTDRILFGVAISSSASYSLIFVSRPKRKHPLPPMLNVDAGVRLLTCEIFSGKTEFLKQLKRASRNIEHGGQGGALPISTKTQDNARSKMQHQSSILLAKYFPSPVLADMAVGSTE